MGYKLNAVFFEIDKEYYFYRYFGNSIEAVYAGEAAHLFVDKNDNVTGYKIEEHDVFDSFNLEDEKQFHKLAKNYKVLFKI